MLALENARYHEPIQVYEGTDGTDNLKILTYPTRSNDQLVFQQRINMQILTDPQSLIPSTK